MLLFDFKNIIRKYIPKNIKQPKRAQIYVGFLCHLKCAFCYYENRCSDKMFSIENIKKQIDFEYKYGIREFEITGGEPSEYKQLREICLYIKNKDYNNKIAIITNGSLFLCNVFDLIDEVLISYHTCKDEQLCNKDIFPLGTTYNKVYKTLLLAKQNNIIIRTNTVIGTFNIVILNNIVNDLIEFRPHIINFLPINLFDTTNIKFEKTIDYTTLRSKIKNIIDIIKTKLPKTYINIRYMPFCDMEGYELHILGLLQHIYDNYDWNRELGGTNLLELINNFDENLLKLGKYGSTSIEAALTARNLFYQKTKKCISCKYFIICDGVEKTKDNKLVEQIIPTNGKIIKNILEYYKQYKII